MTYTAIILDWKKMSRDDRWLVNDFDNDGWVEATRRALDNGHYTRHEVEATDPGHVFERLNIDPPEGYRNRSMSVGDLIIGAEGCVSVRSIGFASFTGKKVEP